jgi:urease accessory protein
MSSFAGHLELSCAADGTGRSYLSHQSFRAPFHLSKPYWDEHALVVQVVNPTAGLFAGDRLRSDVSVGAGARLHLTTPSASRVHTMCDGRAELQQSFQVAEGAWLEFEPAPLIPQRNCRYLQNTSIRVARGGELFFVETLAPGRVAHGECFQFLEIDWECNLYCDRLLVARERFCLRPDDASLNALRAPFPQGYYASCYLITERLSDDSSCWPEIRELNATDVLVGASRLVASGWSIKILARDSVALHRTVQSSRRILAKHLPPLASRARKL